MNALPEFYTHKGVFGPGGNGGGVFATTVGSLGAVKNYPWSTYSEDTKSLQEEINAVLPRLGLARIVVDGRLGPQTCGAIQAIIKSGEFSNWSLPSSCSGQTMTPPEEMPEEMYDGGGTGGRTALLIGGIALFVGGAGYLIWRTLK